MEETKALPNFEEAMKRLAAIVDRLESGEGSLDEMLRLYEEGMGLARACERQLDAYEATITKLGKSAGEPSDAD